MTVTFRPNHTREGQSTVQFLNARGVQVFETKPCEDYRQALAQAQRWLAILGWELNP